MKIAAATVGACPGGESRDSQFSGPLQDRLRPPLQRAMKSMALGLIRFYQACLAPTIPSSCRFYPSCSAYALEAVEKWGVRRGVKLTAERLLRCRPFGGRGYDPVP